MGWLTKNGRIAVFKSRSGANRRAQKTANSTGRKTRVHQKGRKYRVMISGR